MYTAEQVENIIKEARKTMGTRDEVIACATEYRTELVERGGDPDMADDDLASACSIMDEVNTDEYACRVFWYCDTIVRDHILEWCEAAIA